MYWWKLKRRLHTSWLLGFWATGFAVGVIATEHHPYFCGMGWLALGVIAAWLCLINRMIAIVPVIIMTGCMIGLWRGSIDRQDFAVFQSHVGQVVTLNGEVLEDPEYDKSGRLVLKLGAELNGSRAPVWVTTDAAQDIKRSDAVAVKGKISPGFGGFAASVSGAQLMGVQRSNNVMLAVRDGFSEKVRDSIPEPQVSLGLGFLLGQHNALPPDLEEALKIAGLTHIVVASGYNLTILVRLARRLLMKVSKFSAFAGATGLMMGFVAIAGASPSMVRAGLVTGLSLLAWYYGRAFHPFILLSIVAAMTLGINPAFGWGDLGWQLSFLAFGGVMIVAPLMQRYFFGDKKPGVLRQITGETIAAQIVTLPVLALAFGELSNVAIFANLLVLPLVPFAMLLTFLVGVFGWTVPLIAEWVGQAVTLVLAYMIYVADYLSGLPWAQTTVSVNGWVVGVYWTIVIVSCIFMWRKTRFDLRQANLVE